MPPVAAEGEGVKSKTDRKPLINDKAFSLPDVVKGRNHRKKLLQKVKNGNDGMKIV